MYDRTQNLSITKAQSSSVHELEEPRWIDFTWKSRIQNFALQGHCEVLLQHSTHNRIYHQKGDSILIDEWSLKNQWIFFSFCCKIHRVFGKQWKITFGAEITNHQCIYFSSKLQKMTTMEFLGNMLKESFNVAMKSIFIYQVDHLYAKL